MIPSLFLTAALLAAPAPAAAQTQTQTAPAVVAIDPARLAAAKVVIDQVWPLGTYARIMRATMDQVVSGSLAGMYDLKPADLGVDAKTDPATAGKTLRQLAAQQDPAFDERMRITMRVMTDGITDLMSEVEPEVRVALANAYARRFTVEQLGDLHRFFDTPSGRIYAAESMTLMANPDMMKAMQSFIPKMVQGMPALMAKVEAATKHLPPVKKKEASK
ncbi:MAG: DUF2059 domain-containing protein [Sphingomonas sp.]